MLAKLLVLAASACALPLAAQPKIRVTNGTVNQKGSTFEVESKSSRFEFEELGGDKLAIKVHYRGATQEVSTLGSGAVVSQVALKLRNVNQCNLVYVTRRFSPKPELVIFLKENPGQSTHEECQENGYRRIGAVAVPKISVGETFSLSGSFEGNKLTVKLDGKTMWSGNVPWDHQGNSGVRTDNAKVDIVLE